MVFRLFLPRRLNREQMNAIRDLFSAPPINERRCFRLSRLDGFRRQVQWEKAGTGTYSERAAALIGVGNLPHLNSGDYGGINPKSALAVRFPVGQGGSLSFG